MFASEKHLYVGQDNGDIVVSDLKGEWVALLKGYAAPLLSFQEGKDTMYSLDKDGWIHCWQRGESTFSICIPNTCSFVVQSARIVAVQRTGTVRFYDFLKKTLSVEEQHELYHPLEMNYEIIQGFHGFQTYAPFSDLIVFWEQRSKETVECNKRKPFEDFTSVLIPQFLLEERRQRRVDECSQHQGVVMRHCRGHVAIEGAKWNGPDTLITVSATMIRCFRFQSDLSWSTPLCYPEVGYKRPFWVPILLDHGIFSADDGHEINRLSSKEMMINSTGTMFLATKGRWKYFSFSWNERRLCSLQYQNKDFSVLGKIVRVRFMTQINFEKR